MRGPMPSGENPIHPATPAIHRHPGSMRYLATEVDLLRWLFGRVRSATASRSLPNSAIVGTLLAAGRIDDYEVAIDDDGVARAWADFVNNATWLVSIAACDWRARRRQTGFERIELQTHSIPIPRTRSKHFAPQGSAIHCNGNSDTAVEPDRPAKRLCRS